MTCRSPRRAIDRQQLIPAHAPRVNRWCVNPFSHPRPRESSPATLPTRPEAFKSESANRTAAAYSRSALRASPRNIARKQIAASQTAPAALPMPSAYPWHSQNPQDQERRRNADVDQSNGMPDLGMPKLNVPIKILCSRPQTFLQCTNPSNRNAPISRRYDPESPDFTVIPPITGTPVTNRVEMQIHQVHVNPTVAIQYLLPIPLHHPGHSRSRQQHPKNNEHNTSNHQTGPPCLSQCCWCKNPARP